MNEDYQWRMTNEFPMTKGKGARVRRLAPIWSFLRRHSLVICHSSFVIWLFLPGCAVGPNYHRPATDSPKAFRNDGAPTNSSFADLDWWLVYQDTHLQALIREAFTNNYDLRIAMARVEQANALAMQARSQFVPSLSYNGVVGRGRNYVFGSSFPNNGTTVNSATVALNAFWEVDLWGRVRRLNESARAQFLASKRLAAGFV